MTVLYKRSKKLIELLKSKGFKIAAAESCTGGAFTHSLVRVPGASEVLYGGVIAYSNDVKKNLLGVKSETISRFGVVSQEVATEMAIGIREKLRADIGIGVTGYAGPGGERAGEIYVAIDFKGKVINVKEDFACLAVSRDAVIDAVVLDLTERLVKLLECA